MYLRNFVAEIPILKKKNKQTKNKQVGALLRYSFFK
jgi:hypothetical protein